MEHIVRKPRLSMVISLSGITQAGALGLMSSCQKAQIRVLSTTLEMHITSLRVLNNLSRDKQSKTVHKKQPRYKSGAVSYIVWMKFRLSLIVAYATQLPAR